MTAFLKQIPKNFSQPFYTIQALRDFDVALDVKDNFKVLLDSLKDGKNDKDLYI